MSRGLGSCERRLLTVLANTQVTAGALAPDLMLELARAGPVTPAIEASVRRALARLRDKGLVERNGRRWKLSDAELQRRLDERRQWQRQYREQAQKAEQTRRQRTRKREAKARQKGRDQEQRTIRQIAKMLGIFSSQHDGEVVNAARAAEQLRKKIGKTWLELLSIDLPPMNLAEAIQETLRRSGR